MHEGTKRRGAAAMAGAALVFLGAGACSQIAGLDKLDFGTMGQPCTASSECNDMNPCTDDSCSPDQLCTAKPSADGMAATQIPGDCKRTSCSAGMPSDAADDADVPDDHEDCTIDRCDRGKATHTAQQDGTACTVGTATGFCEFGKCAVKCGPTIPCNDMNPCTTDACDMATMVCPFTKLSDGTPTPMAVDTPGDCHQHQCIGGVDTNAVDDTDTPSTTNDCEKPICTAGMASTTHQKMGMACKTAGGAVCDGNGTCVPCNVDADCPGMPTTCKHPSCTSHMCGTTNAASGTACGAASCSGTTFTKASTCNGSGTCSPGATQSCAPYVCQGAACGMTCADDGDCASTAFCAAPDCKAKLADGMPCGGANQCVSNHCIDGVCCDVALCGTCQACNLAPAGTCTLVPAGMQDDSCQTMSGCDGTGTCGP